MYDSAYLLELLHEAGSVLRRLNLDSDEHKDVKRLVEEIERLVD